MATRRLAFLIEDRTSGDPSANLKKITRAVKSLKKEVQGGLGTGNFTAEFQQLLNLVDRLQDSTQKLSSHFKSAFVGATKQSAKAELQVRGVVGATRDASKALESLTIPGTAAKSISKVEAAIRSIQQGNADAATQTRLLAQAYDLTEKEVKQFEAALKKAEAQQRKLRESRQAAAKTADTGFGARPQSTAQGASALNFDGRSIQDIQKIEATVKRLQAENRKNNQLVKDLQRAYGVSEKEAQKIVAEMTKAERATKKAANEAQGLGAKLKGASGNIAGLVKGGLGKFATGFIASAGSDIQRALTAQLANLARFAQSTIVESLANFGKIDLALKQFEARLPAIQRATFDFEALKKETVAVATVTSQTPASVAQLATALLAVGTPADKVQESLRGVASFADVVGEDAVLSGRLLQTGVNIFGKFGETVDTLGDQMAVLVNTTAAGSAQGIDEFFKLFQQAGSIAANLDVQFADLGAAFAVLREGGASSRVAATGLRRVMLSLAAPTTRAAQELKRYGIEAFDAGGNFVGVNEFLKDFQEQTKNLSQEEKASLAATVFGAGGASAILTALDKVGGRLDTIYESVADGAATGGVQESLDIINEALPRQLELLKGVMSAVGAEFGEALAPAARAAIFALRQSFDALVDTGVFDVLAASTERFNQIVASSPELVTAISEAIGTVVSASTAVLDTLIDSFSVVGSMGSGAFSGLLAAFEGIILAIQGVVQFVGILGAVVFAAMSGPFAVAGEVLKVVGEVLASIGNNIAKTISKFVAFREAVTGGLNLDPINLFVGAISLMGDALTSMVDIVYGLISGPMDIFQEVLRQNPELAEALSGAFASLREAMARVGEAFTELLAPITGVSAEIEGGLAGAIARIIGLLGGAFINALTGALDFTADAITQSADFIISVVERAQGLVERARNLIDTLPGINLPPLNVEEYDGAFQEVSDGATEAAGDAEAAADMITGVVSDIGDSYDDAASQIELAGKREKEALLNKGADAEEFAALEARLAQERLANLEEEQNEISALLESGALSGGEAITAQERLATLEGEIQDERVTIAQQGADERERIAEEEVETLKDNLKEIQDTFKAAEDVRDTDRLQERASLVESGVSESDLDEFDLQSSRDDLEALKAQEAELTAAINSGTVDRAEAEAALRDIQKQIAQERMGIAEEEADARVEAAKEVTEALKEQRKEEAEQQQQDFQDRQDVEQESFDEAALDREEAHQEKLNQIKEAGAQKIADFEEAEQEKLNSKKEAFQEKQNAKQEAFNARQQAEQAAFQESQNAKREAFNSRLSAVEREAQRRTELELASPEERAELEEKFARQDEEAEVLRKNQERALKDSSIKADELSPIEQARKDFEAELKAEEQEFAAQQREEQRAFEEQLKEDEKAFNEEIKAEEKALAEEVQRREKQLEEELQEIEKAFAESEREKEKAFQEQQEQREAAFKAEQRRLDEQSANRIKQILESARLNAPAVTPRFRGGPVSPGQTYSIAEKGPEFATFGGKTMLFTSPGYIQPSSPGYVTSTSKSARILKGNSVPDISRFAVVGAPGVEARLDRLIRLQEKTLRNGGGDTYQIFGDPGGPSAQATASQSRLKQAARSGRIG